MILQLFVVTSLTLANLDVVDLAMMSKTYEFFADLLNDNSITNVMLVGIGNMGHALLHYRFHERNKMKIIMAFDLDDPSRELVPRHLTVFQSMESLKLKIKLRIVMSKLLS